MSPALNAYLMVLATLSAVSWAFLPSCIPSKSRPMLEVGEVYDTWMGVNPLRLPIPVQHFHSGVVLHPEVDES